MFTRVARDSQLELLINLWPSARTFLPLPPPPPPTPLSMLRFTGIQSYTYMDQRKVETDVDRMTGIELATLQLRRPRNNRLSYAIVVLLKIKMQGDQFFIMKIASASKGQNAITFV